MRRTVLGDSLTRPRTSTSSTLADVPFHSSTWPSMPDVANTVPVAFQATRQSYNGDERRVRGW